MKEITISALAILIGCSAACAAGEYPPSLPESGSLRKKVEAVFKLEGGRCNHPALDIAVAEWVQADPKAAAEWAAQVPYGGGKDNEPLYQVTAMASLADAWVKINPEEAGQWATQLPDGHMRDRAISALKQP